MICQMTKAFLATANRFFYKSDEELFQLRLVFAAIQYFQCLLNAFIGSVHYPEVFIYIPEVACDKCF